MTYTSTLPTIVCVLFSFLLFQSPCASAQDDVTATIQTAAQNGYAAQSINLTASAPIGGPFTPPSTSGIGTNALSVYNWHPRRQLARFVAAMNAGTAKLVALGDSTTRGFGSAASGWTQMSFPVEMAQAFSQAGVAAQSDNFLGEGIISSANADLRVALVGGAQWDSNAIGAGGSAVQTLKSGDGFVFTLNWPGAYDRVTLSYVDMGTGSVTLAVDGGSVLATLHFANSGNILTQTVTIPAAKHTSLKVVQTGTAGIYIQGAAFWSSTVPALQVQNGGIGGWQSSSADTSYCNGSDVMGSSCGFGQTNGVAALGPSLVLIDLGINDMLNNVPAATTAANIAQIVTTVQAAGADVILMLPNPFNATNEAQQMTALRSALQSLAKQDDLPMIDLSATYADNFAALSAAGLMGSDAVHPDATLYADIASRIAGKLMAIPAKAGIER